MRNKLKDFQQATELYMTEKTTDTEREKYDYDQPARKEGFRANSAETIVSRKRE